MLRYQDAKMPDAFLSATGGEKATSEGSKNFKNFTLGDSVER
jgi:hypothetical protein